MACMSAFCSRSVVCEQGNHNPKDMEEVRDSYAGDAL